MLRQTNSQYLQWYSGIENELSLLFKLFSPLCAECFSRTVDQVEERERSNRQFWCCCFIDNQIHDHWGPLDAIQKRQDSGWYQKLIDKGMVIKKGRVPGNGPCPALGSSGCRITKCRPVTCNTQICEKMLYVLNKAKVIECEMARPLQTEDILAVPDILPELFGMRRNKQITGQDVREYREAIVKLRHAMEAVPEERRRSFVMEAIEFYLEKGR